MTRVLDLCYFGHKHLGVKLPLPLDPVIVITRFIWQNNQPTRPTSKSVVQVHLHPG